DFALFLSGLMAGKVVNQRTLELMLTPQLNEAQEYILNFIAYEIARGSFVPEFPDKLKLTHGIGGVINAEDSPGKRNKGSLTWSGATNSRWVSIYPDLLICEFYPSERQGL